MKRVKIPDTTNIITSDNFKINFNFTNRKRKIKLPMPPQNEKKKSCEDIHKDRHFLIDASIV